MLTYLKKISSWIVLSIAISFIFGFIFIATHQTIRSQANFSLVETAQNIIGFLENDDTADSQVEQLSGQIEQSTKVDLETSDKTVVSIYDNEGKAVASTGIIEGNAPSIDSGVVEAAKKNGVNKVTWEPKEDVRLAIVVYPITNGDNGYLVVAKSLKETESNIDRIGKILLVGWIITLLVTLLSSIVLNSIIDTFDNKKPKSQSKETEVKNETNMVNHQATHTADKNMKTDKESSDVKKTPKMENMKQEKVTKTDQSKKVKKDDK